MYKLVIILSAFLIFQSCKKKKETSEPIVSEPTPPLPDGSLSNATSFSGIFKIETITNILVGASPLTFTSAAATAYFSSQRVNYFDAASSVKISKVYLNNDSLVYNDSYKYYKYYYPVSLANDTWSVSGLNGIATFSYTNVVSHPEFSGINNLPDSISKSSGFTIMVNNVANITSGIVLVVDGTGNTNGSFVTNLAAGNNTITISSANLSSLSTSTNATIGIILKNNKSVVYSGKDYQFAREFQYLKYPIKIKN